MFIRDLKLLIVAVICFVSVAVLLLITENRGVVFQQEKEIDVKAHYAYQVNVNKILMETRLKIMSELRDYNYSLSKAASLTELVPELGGRPVRTLIISSWRTGSTFLGDIINSLPGHFLAYEPLWYLKELTLRDPGYAKDPINLVKKAFKCEYTDSVFNEYYHYEYIEKTPWHFIHNDRLWNNCKDDFRLCTDPIFTEKFCNLFPFQTVKLVRFRLQLAKFIMDDQDFQDVKLILLVRDPRAVMQSRRYDPFCLPYPDCARAEYYCADMLNNYYAVGNLMKLYPSRIMIIRHEELSLEPYKVTRELMKFLNLDYLDDVKRFLKLHTNTRNIDRKSTVRISKDVAFKWKRLFDFNDVNNVQLACIGAMLKWGYQLAHNASHMASDDFNSLGNYTIDLHSSTP